MESYYLTVRGHNKGDLKQNKTIAPSHGLILSVTSDVPHKSHGPNPGIIRASIDKGASRIAAGDSLGNIYIFDLIKERHYFLIHLDRCCSNLAFNSVKRNDLIVASSDCSVTFIDTRRACIRSTSTKHRTCINHIAVNKEGIKAVTSSLDTAVIWDLTDLNDINQMTLTIKVDILKVFFLPLSENIITAFKVDEIFLWSADRQKHLYDFNCHIDETDGDKPPWMRTIDASRDGLLICCGGKKNELLLWDVSSKSSFVVSLENHVQRVKQLAFLSQPVESQQYVVSVLDDIGKLHFFDIKTPKKLCDLDVGEARVATFYEAYGRLAIITQAAALEVYDVSAIFASEKSHKVEKVKKTVKFAKSPRKVCVESKRNEKNARLCKEKLTRKRLKFLLSTNGEFPMKYRTLIWSSLLELPRNENYVIYYKEENINILEIDPNLFSNPTEHKAFLRIYSMILQWCPFFNLVEYFPAMIAPFLLAFHKSVQFCFELLLTYITNWCQNWFWYTSLPPFHLLYAIENLLLYHDRKLLHHFIVNDIPPEAFAFPLLSTSFAQVFSPDDWLKLYDNIFSEPPNFIIFIVIAYLVVCRNVLLKCSNENQLKVFFSRKSILVVDVVKEAHHLRSITPPVYDPTPVIGTFNPLPVGTYPIFNQFADQEQDFQVLDRKNIVADEKEHIVERTNELMSNILSNSTGLSSSERRIVIDENLSQVQELRQSLKNLVLLDTKEKDTCCLEKHEEKVEKMQKMMQKTLQTPGSTLSLSSKSPQGSQISCRDALKNVLKTRHALALNKS